MVVNITPKQNSAFLFDVTDEGGSILTRLEFEKRYGEEFRAARSAHDRKSTSTADISIVIEGDSWANILWPISSVRGFDPNFVDIIDFESDTRVLNFGWPGDTLSNMLNEKEYRSTLRAAQRDFFIFSGAGNDVVGGGAIERLVQQRAAIDPSQPVQSWMATDLVADTYRRIFKAYGTIARECEVWAGGKTSMLVHGYDYVIPRPDGVWLGKPFQRRGYDLVADEPIIREIIRFLIDGLYQTLEDLAKQFSIFHVMNLRNTVNDRWTDELHTERSASEDIAEIFLSHMRGSNLVA